MVPLDGIRVVEVFMNGKLREPGSDKLALGCDAFNHSTPASSVSLLVAKFQQLAMSRQAQRISARRDFWLYIDEFQNFITPSMTEILTGARKYRLGLILAHQELRQLERDRDVASAVLSNPYTRVVFRVGDADARALENGFSFFESKDLQNLERGNATCRIEKADGDFNLAVPFLESLHAEAAQATRQAVIAASRAKYTTARADIEADLLAKLETQTAPEPPPKPTPASVRKDSEKNDAEVRKQTVSETENFVTALLPTGADAEPQRADTAAEELRHESKPHPIPAELGRGGEKHQDIQRQLKEIALSAGYRATTEKPILDGGGSVDVALEKGAHSIAVEVTVTTSIDQEMGNVQKRLKAGFSRIVLVCENRPRVGRLAMAVQGAFGEDAKRIHCCHPDDFAEWLKALPVVSSQPSPPCGEGERISRGYQTRIGFAKVTLEERRLREEAAHRLLVNAMRRENK